jgi:cell division protein FtsA
MFRRSPQPALITGIDLGSTAIRIALGQYTPGTKHGGDLNILGLVEVPSEGLHRGTVTSIEETVSSLSHGLEQLERLTGAAIEHAWIGVSGTHIISQKSKGVVAVAKSDGEISGDDVARAVEAARTVSVPLNYEILHVIPHFFGVDGQTGIKDPVGMTGIRLEVDAQIIFGLTQQIKHLTKAVYRTGIDIDDLVLSILAAGDVVTTSRQRDLGVAVVNIGGSTTSVMIYEEGDIMHTAVLPLGSEYITNDLAIGLRTSIDVAERVKVEYGHAFSKDISKREKINLSSVGSPDEEEVALRYIAEIIEARTEELLEKIDKELAMVGRSGKLPAGIIFTGGGSKLSGLIELAKDRLSLPASLGYPLYMSGGQGKVHDIAFSSALGLVKWGVDIQFAGKKRRTPRLSHGAEKVFERLKDAWKTLMP